jgi:alpha-N-arabinofuranosidase
MREVDPTIELVVCGSSGSQMPTFGTWEETVLELAWDVADHVSVHAYYDPDAFASIDAYLACSRDLDRTIDAVTAIADSVGRRRGSSKRIDLSVDEWNVWRLREHQARENPTASLRHAPPLAEDRQDVADALAVGCLLITLLRHADRVRIACLAQLVNVIPVIRTVDGGPAWRQTTSYPFADVARFGRGVVLRSRVDSPTYAVDREGEVDAVELVAVHDPIVDGLTIFAVNRVAQGVTLEAALRRLPGLAVIDHRVLTDVDLTAANTAEQPHRISPAHGSGARVDRDRLLVTLPGRSWNVIRLAGRAPDAV